MEKPGTRQLPALYAPESPRAHGETAGGCRGSPRQARVPARAWRNQLKTIKQAAGIASPRARMEKPWGNCARRLRFTESPRAHGETGVVWFVHGGVSRVPARAWRNLFWLVPNDGQEASPRARMEKPYNLSLPRVGFCESPRAHGETSGMSSASARTGRVPARAWRNHGTDSHQGYCVPSPRARMEKPSILSLPS